MGRLILLPVLFGLASGATIATVGLLWGGEPSLIVWGYVLWMIVGIIAVAPPIVVAVAIARRVAPAPPRGRVMVAASVAACLAAGVVAALLHLLIPSAAPWFTMAAFMLFAGVGTVVTLT